MAALAGLGHTWRPITVRDHQNEAVEKANPTFCESNGNSNEACTVPDISFGLFHPQPPMRAKNAMSISLTFVYLSTIDARI